MPTALETSSDVESRVRKLVQQHRASKKDRLRLAVYLTPPPKAKSDIAIFEVIDGFGGDAVDPEKKLFEFRYGSTPAFPLDSGTSLHMVLTNPTELGVAIHDGWKGIDNLRAARDAGRAVIIYADPKGKRLWGKIK